MSDVTTLFPIACFSCGKRVSAQLDMYIKLSKDKHPDPFKVLGVRRYCCKRMFTSYIQNKYISTKY